MTDEEERSRYADNAVLVAELSEELLVESEASSTKWNEGKPIRKARTIHPIETSYMGYRFRSRLEARWAVFFDTLNIVYRYEPEGFDLDGKWYLPDFWLPEQDCWIEIKGQDPTPEERKKAIQLALGSGKRVLVLAGDVWT